MFAYDETFDPEVFLGHCDLISWFSDFCLISRHSVGIFSYFFQIMNEYDLYPNVLIGHYDQILWFSDFASYLGTQLVYELTSFYTMFAYDKTFELKVVLGHYDLISRFSDFALYRGTQLVFFILPSYYE